MDRLDSPARVAEIRAVINSKPALKQFYTDIYARYAACLARCPEQGLAVELGSGGGFAREVIPQILKTDVLPYDGIDSVVDAVRMPFKKGSVRFFGMMNVFHHISDVSTFLREVVRCLCPGGRLLLVDQHLGWISGPVLRYLHHEPFDADAAEWRFASTGPLSGANGALAWIVFSRDREKFAKEYPQLRLHGYRPFAPLTYWLAGGLKPWSFSLGAKAGLLIDRALLSLSEDFGSFVEIEIVRE